MGKTFLTELSQPGPEKTGYTEKRRSRLQFWTYCRQIFPNRRNGKFARGSGPTSKKNITDQLQSAIPR
jgi:hypothetical protein